MNKELVRIIVLSVINGIVIHYFNQWLDKKKVLPKPLQKEEHDK